MLVFGRIVHPRERNNRYIFQRGITRDKTSWGELYWKTWLIEKETKLVIMDCTGLLLKGIDTAADITLGTVGLKILRE